MMETLSPFEKLLAGLIHAEVRFITVGGLACAMCGFVRTTEDVDIIVDGDPANITCLLSFLRNWGEGHARELSTDDFTDEEGATKQDVRNALALCGKIRAVFKDGLSARNHAKHMMVKQK